MIELCKTKKLKPILVTTPYLNEYLAEIDNLNSDYRIKFKDRITSISKKLDVPYYDYSNDNRFNNRYDYFMNSDHLCETGAKEFVKILVNETIKK